MLITPYRLNVSATSTVTVGKGKRQRTKVRHYGYMGWTPFQLCGQEARLPDAGSFLYPGFIRAREAAMAYLALPETTQISIRTNQDQTVYVYNKHEDGRITGYAEDCR